MDYLRRTMTIRSRQFVPLLILGLGGGALAQPAPESGADPSLVIEEIVVTGSRIKRKDLTSISPLVTLDAEQITFSGITAAEDLVKKH